LSPTEIDAAVASSVGATGGASLAETTANAVAV